MLTSFGSIWRKISKLKKVIVESAAKLGKDAVELGNDATELRKVFVDAGKHAVESGKSWSEEMAPPNIEKSPPWKMKLPQVIKSRLQVGRRRLPVRKSHQVKKDAIKLGKGVESGEVYVWEKLQPVWQNHLAKKRLHQVWKSRRRVILRQ